MAKSWDSYYVVFIAAILSLGIPGILALVSLFLFPRGAGKKRVDHEGPLSFKKNQTIIGQRINVRFFLAVNAALILIALALELIPCTTTLHHENKDEFVKGLVSIITLAGFAVLGLLYSVRKGDLSWVDSFHSPGNKEKRGQ